jgi:murein DD-endopeptidase MepM/ murein hydrolase activator NlpD
VFPLPKGTWTESSPFGLRTDPFTGATSFHTGIDYAAPLGTPVLAIAAGTVTFAGPDQIYGGLVIMIHQIDGRPAATAYGHMPPGQIQAHTGQRLAAGQQIGQVGSEGRSTGPHLHIEVRPGGPDATAVDPGTWLKAHQAEDLDQPTTGITGACPGSEDQFPCKSIRTLAPSTAPANSATSSEPCS